MFTYPIPSVHELVEIFVYLATRKHEQSSPPPDSSSDNTSISLSLAGKDYTRFYFVYYCQAAFAVLHERIFDGLVGPIMTKTMASSLWPATAASGCERSLTCSQFSCLQGKQLADDFQPLSIMDSLPVKGR
jgi:hypothetical protein